MPTELLESALKLSVEERLQLIEEIRKSIAATPEAAGSLSEERRARLLASKAGIRRAQVLVRSYISEDRCLSDELIAERRSMAAFLTSG